MFICNVERQSYWFTPQMPAAGSAGPDQNQAERDSKTWAITTAFQDVYQQEAGSAAA